MNLSTRRALLVAHPRNASRSARLAQRIEPLFAELEAVVPDDLDHLAEIVGEHREYSDLVIVLGGDGTTHRVVAELDPKTQHLCPLPGGTGNDLSHALGFRDFDYSNPEAWQRLEEERIDLPRVNGLRYHNSGGIGIDAETLRARRSAPDWLAASYELVFLRTLGTIGPISAEIKTPERRLSGEFFWILAMNSPQIGGGLPVTPDAELDDGDLDVLLVRAVSKPRLLYTFAHLLFGSHLAQPGIEYFRTARLTVECERPIEHLALDGELYKLKDEHRLEFSVSHAALRVLAPQRFAAAQVPLAG